MNTMKYKRSDKLVRLFTGVIAVMAALLLTISFATPVGAATDRISTFSGNVIGVDHYGGTVTVMSKGQIDPSMGVLTFTTDDMTSVISCAQNKSFADIGEGQEVTVTYHEKEGKLYAELIEHTTPVVVACLYQ